MRVASSFVQLRDRVGALHNVASRYVLHCYQTDALERCCFSGVPTTTHGACTTQYHNNSFANRQHDRDRPLGLFFRICVKPLLHVLDSECRPLRSGILQESQFRICLRLHNVGSLAHYSSPDLRLFSIEKGIQRALEPACRAAELYPLGQRTSSGFVHHAVPCGVLEPQKLRAERAPVMLHSTECG